LEPEVQTQQYQWEAEQTVVAVQRRQLWVLMVVAEKTHQVL
jgi:hypothetical protein